MSISTIAHKPENTEVKAPIKTITHKIIGEYSKKAAHLITKKIPAVTIVAAWINAETGVGPSIASGNQTCKPICADLPKAPNNRKKLIVVKRSNQ